MIPITKQDLIEAFALRKRKRNQLLYAYYREQYFEQGYPADFVSKKISEELGVPITSNMIYLLKSRIGKKLSQTATHSNNAAKQPLPDQPPAIFQPASSPIYSSSVSQTRMAAGTQTLSDDIHTPETLLTTDLSGMSSTQYEALLHRIPLSIDQLETLFNQENDPGKRALLRIRMNELADKEKYQNQTVSKSMFD